MKRKIRFNKRLISLIMAVALLPMFIATSASETTPEPVLYSAADFRADPMIADSTYWVEEAAPNGADAFVVPIGGTTARFGGFPENCDYYVWEMDIRFSQLAAGQFTGIVAFNEPTGGNTGMGVHVNANRQLMGHSSGTNPNVQYGTMVEWNQWYRLEYIFLANAHLGDNVTVGEVLAQSRLILTPYNTDGTLNTAARWSRATTEMRNFAAVIQYYFEIPRKSPTHIDIQPGTTIANMQVRQAWPDTIALTAPSATVNAGDSLQLGYTASRSGFPSPRLAERTEERHLLLPIINFELRNTDNTPLTSPMVSVSEFGLITVAPNAPDMDILAVGTTITGVESAPVPIKITALEIGMFEVVKFGIETSDGTAEGNLLRVGYVDVVKMFEFDNPVTFTVALFDNEGFMVGVSTSTMRPDWMEVNETTRVNLNLPLPANFNPDTWSLRLFSWTGL